MSTYDEPLSSPDAPALALPRLAALWPIVEAVYHQLDDHARRLVGVHMQDHVLRVAANCVAILREDGSAFSLGDRDTLIAAAYVHDLGYSVAQDDSHATRCLEVAAPILRQAGYLEGELMAVGEIVSTHHDKNHARKSLSQRILYVADKCDGLGFDGALRMFMEWGHSEYDRDKIANKYLTKIGAKVREDLLPVGVGRQLIETRWEEARAMLQDVIQRRAVALQRSQGE